MKTLLIGISSPIGQSFLKASSVRGLDLIAISDPNIDANFTGIHPHKTITCELKNQQKIQEILFQEWPDILINCLEETEDENTMADLNTLFPKLLSQLTHHLGTRFLHISTNAIFDGSNPNNYRSTDTPNPQTFFGQTKLLGEKEILKNSSSNPLILRIPKILSPNFKSEVKSLNQFIRESALSEKVIKLAKSTEFQPTSSINIADVLLELCERNDLHGIFHWAGCETINEYDLALLILRRANVNNPEKYIQPKEETTKKNFCMELQPLKNKLKTHPLNLKELFEELDYKEPLTLD